MQEQLTPEQQQEYLVEAFKSFQSNPFVFLEEVWGLTPQPILHRYKEQLERLYTTPAQYFNLEASLFSSSMFGTFENGKHITWQQTLLVVAVYRAVNGTLPWKISIKSGRGSGKSNIVAKLALWFLYSFSLSRVMATAPNSDLLSAVLWSEMSTSIFDAKEPYSSSFIWQSDFIRMKARPASWFARAKTSRPGEKGALSGLHAEHMMSLVDESSEVDKEVIDTAMHTMTNEGRKLMILISNPHIPTGYFRETFNDPDWINLTFNCEDSPIVSHESVEGVARKYGRDSDEYRVSVLGEFPSEGILGDDKGWRRMYNDNWISAFFSDTEKSPTQHQHQNQQLVHPSQRQTLRLNRPYLGVDVGGEGDDSSEIYGRDDTYAQHVFSERKSTPETVARLTIRAMDELDTSPNDVTVDNFGVGADVSAKIALLSDKESFVNGLNVGQTPEDIDDKKVYLNERARLADMLLKWGIQGGRCANDPTLSKELESVYCREQNSKLQIMSKREAKKLGIKSPNRCFIAGTKVRTPDGEKNIEDFVVGDSVVTLFGKRKVLKVHKNKSNDIYTVKTKGGNILTGTGNHNVFKKDMTRVSMDSLVLGDILDTWQERKLKTLPKWLSTTVESFGYRTLTDIISMMSIVLNGDLKKIQEEEKKSSSIGTSMKKSLVKKYQKITSFTTKTIIHSIINSAIFSVCRRKNTTKNIKMKSSQDMVVSKGLINILQKSDLSQKSGMLLKKVWNGIQNMVKNLGKIGNYIKLLVRSVIWISKPLSLHVHDSAQGNVTNNSQTKSIGITLWKRIVLIVVWHLWQTEEGRQIAVGTNVQIKKSAKIKWSIENAKNVKQIFEENQTDFLSAQVNVIEEMKEKERNVYNLEVEIDNVYYANNILVSNCDSLWLTFAQDHLFSLRVPRGDQLYYPDRQLPPTETSTSPTNIHKMIPM